MTINANPKAYSEPKPPAAEGAWWIITETDAVTGEPTGAEFGYRTEQGAWSAYFLLTAPRSER